MIHLLASIHDEHGDVQIPGLRREPWTGATYEDAEFRELGEVVPGTPLFGTGTLESASGVAVAGAASSRWSGDFDPSRGSHKFS